VIKRYAKWQEEMEEDPDGDWILHSDYAEAMTEIECFGGKLLAAYEDLQRQLADAIRERDQYKAACEMATALRPLGAVHVVEGGGAVLLDTGERK
jgi:hypothetical protein